MDVLVAHDRQTGMFYARAFGMDRGPRPPVIATTVRELRGYGPPTTFVYVNSDNVVPDAGADVVQQLRVLEASGCEVDWV